MTPQDVAAVWHGLAEEWFTRRNKMRPAGKQWQVVHNTDLETADDETMKVVAEFATSEEADALAEELEDEARGKAVLDALANGFL